MINPYRLVSSAYERETELEKIDPLKIYFLSVEGNKTEKEYFKGISKYRSSLNINVIVDIEVLSRASKDTNSAPKHVVELLEEYLRLRSINPENLINDFPSSFLETYGIDFIQKYLDDPQTIPSKRRNQFVTDLIKIGYDINYRRYLKKYNSERDTFGILIDRDMLNHSKLNILECIEYCKSQNYDCYISNPCFEFWLLLHLSDVSKEYTLDELNLMKTNEKISKNHTYISNEVSKKAHHGKCKINFAKNYLPNIDLAIARAKKFANSEQLLIDNIGCNIWKLIEKMRKL